MKKIILSACAILAFNSYSSAQFALGLELGSAYEMDSDVSFSGGSIKLGVAPKDKDIRFGISIGYYANESDLEFYDEFDELVTGYQFNDLYPINISYQQDLAKGPFRPYIDLDGGITFCETSEIYESGYSDFNLSNSYTLLGIGAGIGVRYSVSDRFELNASTRASYYLGDVEFTLVMLNIGGTLRF